MRRLDELNAEYPFYASRQLMRHLPGEGVTLGRHRIRRLMRRMGIKATYRRPRTSTASPEHRIFPYPLRDLTITRADHVWCADITYVPLTRGFFYLVAVMDRPMRPPARVAAIEHVGRLVLRRGTGRRAGSWETRDPQHRQ